MAAYTSSILRYGYLGDRPLQVGRALLMMLLALTFPIGGGAAQVSTLTVGSASDAAYTATITPQGRAAVAIYYNEGAAGTLASKATGIAAQINGNALLAGIVTASAASDVVTITALKIGTAGAFTLATSDGKLTAATGTSGADADSIPFGCAVVHTTGGKVVQPKTSRAVAKVVTVTPANATNSEIYTLNISIDADGDGIPESYPIPYQDASVTVQRIVEAMAAAISANAALAAVITPTENNTVLTLTGIIPGLDFTVTATVTDDAGAAPTGSLTVATTTANVTPYFAGVAQAQDVPEQSVSSAVGTAKWDGQRGQGCPTIRAGVVPVRLDAGITTITPGDPVCYRLDASGTGEEYGTFRNAKSGSDTLTLPPSRARWVDGVISTDLSGNSCALLELT